MNTILNSLSEADKNKSFLTIYKDGADFDIKLSDFTSAISKGSLKLLNDINLSANLIEVTDSIGTISPLQLSTEAVGLSRTVNLSAGATTPRLFNVVYTINNSGVQTGALTGLFLNATETALNGMTHNLMDLQVGGVSKFRVRNNNFIDIYNNTQLTWITYNGYLYHDANNFQMSTATSILFTPATGLIKLGGTTSSFPAIKRNGATIDFRLADDSNYCNIRTADTTVANLIATAYVTCGGAMAFEISAKGTLSAPSDGVFLLRNNANTDFSLLQFGGTTNSFPALQRYGSALRVRTADNSGFADFWADKSYFSNVMAIGTTLPNTSAFVQIDSTTRGFLMPRMTQAQILLIATPAAGLMVYNTDLQTPCFYDGTAARWERCSHSVM